MAMTYMKKGKLTEIHEDYKKYPKANQLYLKEQERVLEKFKDIHDDEVKLFDYKGDLFFFCDLYEEGQKI